MNNIFISIIYFYIYIIFASINNTRKRAYEKLQNEIDDTQIKKYRTDNIEMFVEEIILHNDELEFIHDLIKSKENINNAKKENKYQELKLFVHTRILQDFTYLNEIFSCNLYDLKQVHDNIDNKFKDLEWESFYNNLMSFLTLIQKLIKQGIFDCKNEKFELVKKSIANLIDFIFEMSLCNEKYDQKNIKIQKLSKDVQKISNEANNLQIGLKEESTNYIVMKYIYLLLESEEYAQKISDFAKNKNMFIAHKNLEKLTSDELKDMFKNIRENMCSLTYKNLKKLINITYIFSESLFSNQTHLIYTLHINEYKNYNFNKATESFIEHKYTHENKKKTVK